MFKDDQMLPMLTGIVVMLAIGLAAQRYDLIWDFVAGDGAPPEPIVLAPDSAVANTGTLQRIDVLLNDDGLLKGDEKRLVLTTRPGCGDVFVQDGMFQYFAAPDCTQFQTFKYGLRDDPTGVEGLVQIRIKGAPEQTVTAEPVVESAEKNVEGKSDAEIAAEERVAAASEPSGNEDGAASLDDVAAAVSNGATRADLSEPVVAAAPAAPAPAATDAGANVPNAPEEGVIGDVDAAALATPEVVDTRTAIARLSDVPVPLRRAERTNAVRFEAAESQPVTATDADTAPQAGVDADASPNIGVAADLGVAEAQVSVARIELSEPLAESPDELSAVGTIDTTVGFVLERAREITEVARGRVAALAPELGIGSTADRPELVGQIAPPEGAGISVLTDPSNSDAKSAVRSEVIAALNVPRVAGSDLTAPGAQDFAVSRPPQPEEVIEEVAAPRADPSPVAPEPDVDVAALTPADPPCVVPPSVTLDIQSFGQTGIELSSPCHPNTVLELSYSGLDLAMQMDGTGRAAIMALGFEQSSKAKILLPGGEKIDFDIPFSGIDRVTRVAIAWNDPVELNLHALEFQAEAFSENDVNVSNPRALSEVRRRGGGYMSEFLPASGKGQFVQIYSHVLKRRGNSGIVDLTIDFASRDRDRLATTCSGGALAQPGFTVVKSEQGEMKRPFNGRLAVLDCADVPTDRTLLSVNSIGSLIISP